MLLVFWREGGGGQEPYQDFTVYSDCTIIYDVTNINGILFSETM